SRQRRADRRSGDRQVDAEVAGPQPVRQGEEPRGCLRVRPHRQSAFRLRPRVWRRLKSLSAYVIPAPLARAAGERVQAGTHAPHRLLTDRFEGHARAAAARNLKGGNNLEVHGSRPCPAWALAGPSGAGMTWVEAMRRAFTARR